MWHKAKDKYTARRVYEAIPTDDSHKRAQPHSERVSDTVLNQQFLKTGQKQHQTVTRSRNRIPKSRGKPDLEGLLSPDLHYFTMQNHSSLLMNQLYLIVQGNHFWLEVGESALQIKS